MERLPLCVDCDGTLIRSDLLFEAMLQLVKTSLWFMLLIPFWMSRGKAYLKMEVAKRSTLAIDSLPYNNEFLEHLREERAAGRRIALVTGAPAPLAEAVAKHAGVFSEIYATTESCNLTGSRKRDFLCTQFGERKYEYAANSAADLPIWRTAAAAIVVNAPAGLARSVAKFTIVAKEFPRLDGGPGVYARALRVHQWVKNLLLFVPLVVSHQATNPRLLVSAAVGFACFSLCASAVYVLNDLLDLQSDRLHPRKRSRPFAAGQLSVPQGLLLGFACLTVAVALSLTLPLSFGLTLGAYLLTTTAYSVALKRRAVVDVLVLGGLYTMRIIAGSAATLIFPSFWLLALSMFLFLSLAVVKRYAELLVMAETGQKDLHGRGYSSTDLPILLTFGIANGTIAVLVLALYVNSPEVHVLYQSPEMLWLMPPLILYWISRVWLKTHRGQMHDDPIVFAASDRPSLIAGALLVGLLLIATFLPQLG